MPSNQKQIIEPAKFNIILSENLLWKNTEKQVGAMNSLDFSYEKDELKKMEGIFPKHMLNDLIVYKFKKIVKLLDIIKTDDLYYKAKCRKIYNFTEYSLPIVFIRDIKKILMMSKVTSFNSLKSTDKGIKTIKKSYF